MRLRGSLPFLLCALLGCAGQEPLVEDARAAVQRTSDELARMRDLIEVACRRTEAMPAAMPPEWCREAQRVQGGLVDAYAVMREVVP